MQENLGFFFKYSGLKCEIRIQELTIFKFKKKPTDTNTHQIGHIVPLYLNTKATRPNKPPRPAPHTSFSNSTQLIIMVYLLHLTTNAEQMNKPQS